ncbi:MAG: hypothetical protein AAGB02_07730, partial [Pseudomonadota bacterium]
HVDIDETILTVYDRMMRIYETETAGWSEEELIELRYSELDNDPLAALKKIYSTLGLPGFSEAKEHFASYLASVKSFEKNKFDYDDGTAELVRGRLGYFIEKWAYDAPGTAGNGPIVDGGQSDDRGQYGETAA